MRKTISKEWAYTLEKFSQVSSKDNWLLRYRVAYFQQYINLKSFNRISYNFLLNIYLLLIQSFSMLKGSLFQRSQFLRHGEIIFFLSQNLPFLQHVVPIIEKYETEGKQYTILCPGPEYEKIQKYLLSNSKTNHGRLIKIEATGKKDALAFLKWILFPLFFAVDFSALAKLRLKNIFLIPADFAKFSLVKRIYEKRIEGWISGAGILITATDHWLWESVLHEKTKVLGIPNYVIQHGLFGDVFYPLIGSHLCVWGEFYRRKLIDDLGAHESEVIVTGSGYFDKLYLDFRKISAEKKYITFMSQPFGKTPLRLGAGTYEQAVSWLNSLEPLAQKYNLTLLVKLHPRDKEEFYPQLKNFLFTKKSLPEILSQSKITITVSSTSILEASLLDLPVIQLFNPSFTTFYDLSKSGLSIIANGEQQLFELVEKLLSDESVFTHAVERGKEGQQQHFYRLGDSLKYFDQNIGLKD